MKLIITQREPRDCSCHRGKKMEMVSLLLFLFFII